MFQLSCTRERLAQWGKIDMATLPEDLIAEKQFSHRHYPVMRMNPASGEREIAWMREGLIPSYAHDEHGAEGRVEAHAESATCTSCFSAAFRRRRCLIPASVLNARRRLSTGDGASRTFAPYSGEIFGIAAVWETWSNEQGHEVQTFAVVTGVVVPLLRSLFDRLPIIIPAEEQEQWLRSSRHENPPLDLLKPLSVAELGDWEMMPDDAAREKNQAAASLSSSSA